MVTYITECITSCITNCIISTILFLLPCLAGSIQVSILCCHARLSGQEGTRGEVQLTFLPHKVGPAFNSRLRIARGSDISGVCQQPPGSRPSLHPPFAAWDMDLVIGVARPDNLLRQLVSPRRGVGVGGGMEDHFKI